MKSNDQHNKNLNDYKSHTSYAKPKVSNIMKVNNHNKNDKIIIHGIGRPGSGLNVRF